MSIDRLHPRAASLRIRQKLISGLKQKLATENGLLAHGRGEAFDYLLGEKTHPFAREAAKAASAYLLLAKHPVLSINGNIASLAAREYVTLSNILHCPLEVNLFHFTNSRCNKIEQYIKSFHPKHLLSYRFYQKVTLPQIKSDRKVTLREGIASADVVLVPLEDGDRTEVLIGMEKTVVTIDLNPLSRTAGFATVTIIDHINRALPLLLSTIRELKNTSPSKLQQIIASYNNKKILASALQTMEKRLHSLSLVYI